MMRQRPFTKGFKDEAIRLMPTSGRTQPEIAGDLGLCHAPVASILFVGCAVGRLTIKQDRP
jgi:hypothetical protein